MKQDQDKKHKRIGWITSIGTQVGLLVLFYFLIAWKEPFPPIPSYGIELSFGIEDQGSGEQQVTSPEVSEEVVEEIQESDQSESIEEPVEEADPEAEEFVDETLPERLETPLTDASSPDVVETKTEKSEQAKEEPKQEKVEQTELNPKATMPKSDKSEDTNESKGTTEKKGNEGKEEGTIDGRALMGQQGTTDGANLNMAGWTWDNRPDPKDESSESGKIVYKIKIDDSGYIIDIELISSTISPVVERYYRQSVEKITFSQTTNTPAPPTSSGTITFIIRSK